MITYFFHNFLCSTFYKFTKLDIPLSQFHLLKWKLNRLSAKLMNRELEQQQRFDFSNMVMIYMAH